jgi:N-acetylglucosaminyl-diphospho-decaprenol L-rhamnosyltransferase
MTISISTDLAGSIGVVAVGPIAPGSTFPDLAFLTPNVSCVVINRHRAPLNPTLAGIASHGIVQSFASSEYADALNTAVRQLPSELAFVLIIKPGIQITTATVCSLLAAASAPTTAVVGPRIEALNGTLFVSAHKFPQFHVSRHRPIRQYDLKESESLDVDWVTGLVVLIRRTAFDGVGGFDLRYKAYLEDVDICWRLSRHGLLTKFESEAQASVLSLDIRSRTRLRCIGQHHRDMYRFASATTYGPKRLLLPILAVGLLARATAAIAIAITHSYPDIAISPGIAIARAGLGAEKASRAVSPRVWLSNFQPIRPEVVVEQTLGTVVGSVIAAGAIAGAALLGLRWIVATCVVVALAVAYLVYQKAFRYFSKRRLSAMAICTFLLATGIFLGGVAEQRYGRPTLSGEGSSALSRRDPPSGSAAVGANQSREFMGGSLAITIGQITSDENRGYVIKRIVVASPEGRLCSYEDIAAGDEVRFVDGSTFLVAIRTVTAGDADLVVFAYSTRHPSSRMHYCDTNNGHNSLVKDVRLDCKLRSESCFLSGQSVTNRDPRPRGSAAGSA